MKTLRLILFAGVLIAALLSVEAQVFAKRYTNRRMPQAPPPLHQTPATNKPPQQTSNSITNAAPAPPIVVTQVVYRMIPPPADPEKNKAAKAEAVRKTVEFQKMRAEEGFESAQYELGLRYLKGDGVEKDELAARKWLALSSKNGYGAATKKLEELDGQTKSGQ
jgi:hypothetical protein